MPWILDTAARSSDYSLDQVCDEIVKHEPLTGYEKTKKYYLQANDIYKRLKPFLAIAKTNALRTGSFNPDNLQKGLSEMHKLFSELGL